MRRRPKPERKPERHVVTATAVDARHLVVLDEHCKIWMDASSELYHEGSIIWITPPHWATDADIAKAKENILYGKKMTIKVLPRAPAPDVVLDREETAPAEDDDVTIREVVMTMVEGANTQDRARLHEVVEHALSEVGL